jgi:ribonuclease P/MRP protein subunit RPP1
VRRYETAVATPTEAAATVDRLATAAADCGYDGLVVTNADGEGVTVAGDHPVDVVDGVTVTAADAERAAGRLGAVRSGAATEYTVVTVVGAPGVTRFAAEDDRVDALLLPGDRDADFDHVDAAAAREHGVRVALDCSLVLREQGSARVRALRRLRRRAEVLADAGVDPLVTARARSAYALRAPRELAAVGERVGLDDETVHAGLGGWAAVVAAVRERTAPEFVEPGVRRGRHRDADDPGGKR